LRLRRQDLDRVTRDELVVQGHQLAAHLRADRAVAHVRVDGVGEVDGGGALRQVDDVALGGEHEDPASGQVDLQALHELPGVGHVLQPIHHLAQPREVGGILDLLGALLVAPVRRDAELRRFVHLVRPDLHFQRLRVEGHHRRVQRLVQALLRISDVVVERPRQRAPHPVHDTERGVAVGHRVDQ